MSNSSVTEEDVAPFDSTTYILVQPIANLTIMFYIYGIYTVLFIISLHILIHQQDRPNRVLYMFFTIALFTLTSAYIVVETFGYAYQATLEFTFTKNQDWALFLAYLYHDNAKTIITLESGILYPIFLATYVVYTLLLDPDAGGSIPFQLFIVTYQVAGIAPTLIIIRAARGKTVEHTSMNQVVSSLHFANGAASGSGNSDPRSHVQTIDIERGLLAERIQNPGKKMSA
uniref:Uncharacterized protein n=1 Tax=Moniliophthora roreri TaxID=221103 RepID=A0A0W0G3F0_MONRR